MSSDTGERSGAGGLTDGPVARRPDGPLAAALAVVAAVALGVAIHLGDGTGVPGALRWLGVAVLAVFGGVLLRVRPGAVAAALTRALPLLALVAVAAQLVVLTTGRAPTSAIGATEGWRWWFGAGALVVLLAAVAMVWGGRLVRFGAVAVVLAVHAAMGVAAIRAAPQPLIDVYLFQQDSVAALLAGTNPYALTFPNPYSSDAFYGPGLVVDGQLMFGFPYPPLSLFASTLGELIAGDVRYAQLAAMTLAALAMATLRAGPLGGLAAALFLFTPRNVFVLEQSWTEPFLVLFLAATIWCAVHRPRVTPWVLGLFVGVKQTAAIGLAGVALLARRVGGPVRLLVPAFAVAVLLTLPLALLDPGAFWHSVVALQFSQPFRFDALSFLVPLSDDQGRSALGTAGAFGAAALAMAAVWWRSPRTPAGAALAVAAIFMAFFVLNKQAFANYYFLVIGALCLAVAAHRSAGPRQARPDTDTAAPPAR